MTKIITVGQPRWTDLPGDRAVCIIPSIAELDGSFGYRVMLKNEDHVHQIFLIEDSAKALAELINADNS